MKNLFVLLCLLTTVVGCTVNTTPNSNKSTSYTLDSVNTR
jgi:hypothetical protein